MLGVLVLERLEHEEDELVERLDGRLAADEVCWNPPVRVGLVFWEVVERVRESDVAFLRIHSPPFADGKLRTHRSN